jgi:3-oxoacyl-[acyl-carrier-protein] synthase-1
MTVASVRAGISRYAISDYYAESENPVTMSLIPDEFFDNLEIEIDEGDFYGAQHDRVIKMAVTALKEALNPIKVKNHIPLIMAFPEAELEGQRSYSDCLKTNLLAQKDFPLNEKLFFGIHTGRSAGIEALDLAFHFLYERGYDHVIIGASDSYVQCPGLEQLEHSQRLLTKRTSDAFAPGEAAVFLVLTKEKSKAMCFGSQRIGLSKPGKALEQGYITSEEPYLGEGLSQAITQALLEAENPPIDFLFSSMNGERYWSKEFGVSMLRNKKYLDKAKIEHPADCYGDVGAATGPLLMGLAAANLVANPHARNCIVYASSDGPARSAVNISKTQ